jgi:hypothetical protein
MQKSHTFISLNICIFFDKIYSDIKLTEVHTMIKKTDNNTQ